MFGNKKGDISMSSSTTIITKCMEIKGNVKGCGTMHIDGTVHGDVIVEESVIIGAEGIVYGNVKAKHVLVSGTLDGSIICDSLEVRKSGSVSNKVDAKTIISDGKMEATLYASEMIHITDNAMINTSQIKSKHIIVNGHVTGNLTATELLEINKNGQVKGEMVVKKIKVTEGGLMLGTMLTYEASSPVIEIPNVTPKIEEQKGS